MKNVHRMMVTVFSLIVANVFAFLTPLRAQEVMPLAPGKSLEREISGGQTHTYRIALQAGQFVHFDVQQTSCDIAFTFTAPDGKKREVNLTPYGLPETLAEEIVTTGEYQLAVQSKDFPKMMGLYRLQVEVRTTPSAQDRKRLQAERLLGELTPSSTPRQAIEKAQQALMIWRELGERFWESNAYAFIAEKLAQSSEVAKAVDQIQQALVIVRELKIPIGEAHYLDALSFYFLRQGQREKAIEYANQASMIAQQRKARSLEASLLTTLGDYNFGKADYDKALAYYEQSKALRLGLGDATAETSYTNVKGMIALRQK